jgi:multiple sugar transport system permease protein
MTSIAIEAAEPVAATPSWRRRAPRSRRQLLAAVMVLPTALFLVTFVYLPALLALGIGFFHYRLRGVGTTFAGLDNFKSAVTYPIFWVAARNTGLFALIMVPTTVVLATAIALAVNAQSRAFAVIRSIILLPYVTPVVATAIGWIWIFNPQYGVANLVLHTFGLPESSWLLSTRMALPSIALYTLWHGLGFDVIILLGALAGLPSEVVEAAAVDGASRLRRFWHVQLPLLSPTLFFIVFISTLGALQSFSQIYALTSGRGGPEYATTTLMLLVYQTAFADFHLSYGAAMALILVVMILIVVGAQRYLARRWAFYQ